MTYDPTTDAGLVRFRINDKDGAIFTDAEIDALLLVEDGWRRAAALGLETIATSEALIQKVIRTLDLQTDGAKLAAELRAQAATLRRQADDVDTDGNAGAFSVVPASYGGGNVTDEFARPVEPWGGW